MNIPSETDVFNFKPKSLENREIAELEKEKTINKNKIEYWEATDFTY